MRDTPTEPSSAIWDTVQQRARPGAPLVGVAVIVTTFGLNLDGRDRFAPRVLSAAVLAGWTWLAFRDVDSN